MSDKQDAVRDTVDYERTKGRINASLILTGLTAMVIILAAFNRLLSADILRHAVLDIFRVCDILAVFVFAPLVVLLLRQLLRVTAAGNKQVAGEWMFFTMGVYLLGVGFGMHEPMNILSSKTIEEAAIKQSIDFFDDGLGHWVFFGGFVLMIISIVKAEAANPLSIPLRPVQSLVIVVIGLTTGVVIFFNMYREETAADIAVLVAALFCISVFRLRYPAAKWRCLPLTTTSAIAFLIGAAGTLCYWWLFA